MKPKTAKMPMALVNQTEATQDGLTIWSTGKEEESSIVAAGGAFRKC